jgi:hypothetical protein
MEGGAQLGLSMPSSARIGGFEISFVSPLRTSQFVMLQHFKQTTVGMRPPMLFLQCLTIPILKRAKQLAPFKPQMQARLSPAAQSSSSSNSTARGRSS